MAWRKADDFATEAADDRHREATEAGKKRGRTGQSRSDDGKVRGRTVNRMERTLKFALAIEGGAHLIRPAASR